MDFFLGALAAFASAGDGALFPAGAGLLAGGALLAGADSIASNACPSWSEELAPATGGVAAAVGDSRAIGFSSPDCQAWADSGGRGEGTIRTCWNPGSATMPLQLARRRIAFRVRRGAGNMI